MNSSESNQDQFSLISISIYLPLLIFFILLSINSNKSLKQQYNNMQLGVQKSPEILNILREQQIFNAREQLKSFFTNYPSFQEVSNTFTTNNFLVFQNDYQNILQYQDIFLEDDINLFFTKLFQNISMLENIKLEIILPEQFSFTTLTNFKSQIDKLLLKNNLSTTIYSIGIRDNATDEIYFNFKLRN